MDPGAEGWKHDVLKRSPAAVSSSFCPQPRRLQTRRLSGGYIVTPGGGTPGEGRAGVRAGRRGWAAGVRLSGEGSTTGECGRRRARVRSCRATRGRAGGGGRRRKDLELEGFVEVGDGPEEGPRGGLLARLLQLGALRRRWVGASVEGCIDVVGEGRVQIVVHRPLPLRRGGAVVVRVRRMIAGPR